MFSFYGFMCHDHRVRAADLRMYNQQEQVCDVSMARNQMFGVASQIARYARGPMGGLYALGEALSMGLTGLVYLFVCLKAWAGAFGVGEITQYVGATTQLFAGVTGIAAGPGRGAQQCGFPGNLLYLSGPSQSHVSWEPYHREALGPPVPGGVPGRVLPLPGERALGAAAM